MPHSPPSPAAALRTRRLAQIFRRDAKAEGRFWYSVVTTRVYCRPTCPARHAHARNIRLHDTLDEARATGFRACARCRPEAASQIERDKARINMALRLIENADPALSPRELAAAVALSPSQFYKVFRRVTGMTPGDYERAARSSRHDRPRTVRDRDAPAFLAHPERVSDRP